MAREQKRLLYGRHKLSMASWKVRRRQACARDCGQCQICGDAVGCPFTVIHVHHVQERSRGGTDDLENLVTLCDLCHAVVHSWMGPAWFGHDKFPLGERERVGEELKLASQMYRWFLSLPPDRRRRVQLDVWAQFGISRRPGPS